MSNTLLDAYLTERELARRRALNDPEYFARRYLSHYLTVEPADFHRELYSYMREHVENAKLARQTYGGQETRNSKQNQNDENAKPEFSESSACPESRRVSSLAAVVGSLARPAPCGTKEAVADVQPIRNPKRILRARTESNSDSVSSVSSVAESRRFAFAAPRGHAKSTIVTLSFALWALCAGRKRLIVIVSDTAAQAEMFLDDIRHELEHNADLREDFGEMVGETWRTDHLQIRSGGRILAKGTGAGLRGLRSGTARPDLIICDDIENDENTATPEQRRKVWRWFSRTLINTLDPNGALWVIGTILHHDSLLANLTQGNEERGIERWPGKVWRALNEMPFDEALRPRAQGRVAQGLRRNGELGMRNAEFGFRNIPPFDKLMALSNVEGHSAIRNPQSEMIALWPSMWPVEKLLARKKEIGTLAFAQEFQNEPCGPEDAIFKTEWLEHPDAWYEALPQGLDFFQAVDPAISTGSDADYFCHVTIGRDPQTGDLFVAEIIRARLSFDRQVALVIDQANRWRPVQVAIESVAYQAGLADAVSARAALPLVRIQSPRDKITRAMRLSSIIENHKLKLRRGDTASATLRDELLQFPHGAHDDQVDALGYAVELTSQRAEPRAWVL